MVMVSGSGTIYDNFPLQDFQLTTEQLANAPSIDFTWSGGSGEYQFALYNANGEAVVPPSIVRSGRFTLRNPGELTEGNYVWQVFERGSGGRWETLPSSANTFTVTQGEAPIRDLPIMHPGELYGNR
jgi:hypothetical protein